MDDNTADETIDDVMARVAHEISKVGVGKSGTNREYNYKFRPIDEVMNTVGPIMARHGLAMTVEFTDRVEDKIQTKAGGLMLSVVVTGRFTYRWKDQSRSTVTIGEARDVSGMATNKAMAMAAKYAHVLTFNIPVVGVDDADYGNGKHIKTVNDTADRGEPAGLMPPDIIDLWKRDMDSAETKTILRDIVRRAFAEAHEYGDAAAHEVLKEHSLKKINRGLPE